MCVTGSEHEDGRNTRTGPRLGHAVDVWRRKGRCVEVPGAVWRCSVLVFGVEVLGTCRRELCWLVQSAREQRVCSPSGQRCGALWRDAGGCREMW